MKTPKQYTLTFRHNFFDVYDTEVGTLSYVFSRWCVTDLSRWKLVSIVESTFHYPQ